MSDRVKVKIAIANLIEVAYSKNKGVTTSILRTQGRFQISVDEKGKATLTGRAGSMSFKADRALVGLGAQLKNASIMFENGDGFNVKYEASFTFVKFASISVSDAFDLEKMILSCSGLLCRAARSLKGREAYNLEILRLMGGV